MCMVFRALMMTNDIVLLTDLTMVITFTYVTFCSTLNAPICFSTNGSIRNAPMTTHVSFP